MIVKEHFCPICGIQIIPKCQRNIYTLIKKNSCCRKCGYKKRRSYSGENNPFYGKKHTEESIIKRKQNIDYSVYKTEEFRQKMSEVTSGGKNGMCGRNVYDVWVEKHGIEEAEKRNLLLREKRRINSTGSNNSMYGVPPPKGCGAGWSGWYKGYFFRSLHELAFLMKTPIDSISSAERKEYAIKYIIDGIERNYFADYIVNNDTLVEIKPNKLQKLKDNIIKKQYAEDYCKKVGWKYIMIDCGIVKIHTILDEMIAGNIKLTNRTQEKFDEYIKSINTGR